MNTLTLPTVTTDIAPELLEQYAAEQQIVVIIEVEPISWASYAVYVDPKIRLIDPTTGAEARLVTAANVSLYPAMTVVDRMEGPAHLVFTTLPKSSQRFDLIEPKRPNLNPWRIPGIERNRTDVYRVKV